MLITMFLVPIFLPFSPFKMSFAAGTDLSNLSKASSFQMSKSVVCLHGAFKCADMLCSAPKPTQKIPHCIYSREEHVKAA